MSATLDGGHRVWVPVSTFCSLILDFEQGKHGSHRLLSILAEAQSVPFHAGLSCNLLHFLSESSAKIFLVSSSFYTDVKCSTKVNTAWTSSKFVHSPSLQWILIIFLSPWNPCLVCLTFSYQQQGTVTLDAVSGSKISTPFFMNHLRSFLNVVIPHATAPWWIFSRGQLDTTYLTGSTDSHTLCGLCG